MYTLILICGILLGIIYEIKDICTDTIQIVNKSIVYHVVKQDM